MKEFDRLVEIIKRLRGEGGCPWDREQTLETLKPCLMEETCEVLEAMDEGGNELKGELGDLLMNIVFQADICADEGKFTIEDVARGINEKMIRRHPHVFKEKNDTITLYIIGINNAGIRFPIFIFLLNKRFIPNPIIIKPPTTDI